MVGVGLGDITGGALREVRSCLEGWLIGLGNKTAIR